MWGFTGIFDQSNGGGFLTDLYPQARKAIWDFSGIYATSRHIRDVRFAGLIHPGKKGRVKLFKKSNFFPTNLNRSYRLCAIP
jgi:acetamidase/formamidase